MGELILRWRARSSEPSPPEESTGKLAHGAPVCCLFALTSRAFARLLQQNSHVHITDISMGGSSRRASGSPRPMEPLRMGGWLQQFTARCATREAVDDADGFSSGTAEESEHEDLETAPGDGCAAGAAVDSDLDDVDLEEDEAWGFAKLSAALPQPLANHSAVHAVESFRHTSNAAAANLARPRPPGRPRGRAFPSAGAAPDSLLGKVPAFRALPTPKGGESWDDGDGDDALPSFPSLPPLPPAARGAPGRHGDAEEEDDFDPEDDDAPRSWGAGSAAGTAGQSHAVAGQLHENTRGQPGAPAAGEGNWVHLEDGMTVVSAAAAASLGADGGRAHYGGVAREGGGRCGPRGPQRSAGCGGGPGAGKGRGRTPRWVRCREGQGFGRRGHVRWRGPQCDSARGRRGWGG